MRWNQLFDGTRESLLPKSHRPKTPHPNAHTEQELSWIRNYHRRTPISQYVSDTANLGQKRDIPDIPVPCTAFFSMAVLGWKTPLQKRKELEIAQV